MAEISIGSDDGLLVGDQLIAYRHTPGRGATYLGPLEVVAVAPDKAVCKIDRKQAKGTIQRGDRVVTKPK